MCRLLKSEAILFSHPFLDLVHAESFRSTPCLVFLFSGGEGFSLRFAKGFEEMEPFFIGVDREHGLGELFQEF